MDLGKPNAIWPFWPVRMRIHPLTRLTTEDSTDRHVIEARIEFTDAQGATSKAVGTLTLELVESPPASPKAEPIAYWNQNLHDPIVNQRQYDVVTQTYLFRLEVDPEVMSNNPELRAYFVSMDGQKFEAAIKIRP